MRQLQLPNRDGAQRFVVSDDGSGDEIGNVSGSRPASSFSPLFSHALQAMMTLSH